MKSKQHRSDELARNLAQSVTRRRAIVRSRLLISCLLATCCAVPGTAAAQGTSFTYQGRLSDNGIAPNSDYDLRFAVYDALSGGNQAGAALTNRPVTVSNGLFTVSLDFGVGVFSGPSRWLEIGVR